MNRTHCPAGHPYDEDNVYYSHGSTPQCRTCRRHRMRVRRLFVRDLAEGDTNA